MSRMRTIARLLLPLATLTASLIVVQPEAHAAPVVVSQVAKNGSKGYLQVDGKPFTINGVESFGEWQTYGNGNMSPVPTDQSTRILPQDWLENTFEKTAAAGFSTIQIELAWNQIEPTTQGVYDWTLIDKYVTWARKYNLKIDIVWWGANGCGGGVLPGSAHGFMTSVPAYLQDQAKYWGDGGNGEEVFPYLPIPGDSHYGDATYLFSSERAAVNAMFDHLATVDTSHQTIMFQVYNEPNNDTSTWTTQHALWLSLVDQLGAAVKSSDYVVATRVNLSGSRIPSSDINALPNIDFVGPDDYHFNVSDIASAVKDTAKKSDIAYIPETYSTNPSLSSIAATALVNGGFINFWQLNDSWADQSHSLYGIPSNGYPSYTTWTLGTIPTMPEGAARITLFNTAVNKMTQLVAKALPQDMAGFNIATDTPVTDYAGTAVVDGAKITYTATDKSIGLALYDSASDSYYLVSDTGGSATYNLGSSSATAQAGSFDSTGTWVSQGTRTVSGAGDIQINPGELLKVSHVTPVRNLAPGGSASASSAYTGQGAAKAVDGDTGTQWSASDGTFPQSLTVDLGSAKALTAVRQRFAETDGSTYKYTVQGSTDNSTWTTLADHSAGVTTSSPVTDSVTGTWRYVKLTVTGINNSHWANSKEFEIFGPTQNLAPGGSASASSAYTGQGAAKAVDGDTGTQWTAGSATFPQSLTVDLGSAKALTAVRQRFAETDGSTYKYTVQGSTDNSTWTTLADHSAGVTTSSPVTDFVTGTWRYVRLTVTGINNSHWANSKEFEIFG
ncbi:discoidin domain-containing protein [Streptomyces chartreusis]|uniref:discoidin domain-containing protein n=1 Tax=Streptomyces chartreusis TaxID=1969 RepID=UPI003626A871